MPSASHRDSLIDLLKALAAQFIVMHHLAVYGPMADTVQPAAPALFGWLHDYALMAVQAFLVVGGYLAASTLLKGGATGIAGQVWRRYLRLMQPYAVALAAAIVCAALARWLVAHEDTPAAPTLAQMAAHLTLLQHIVDADSLSLGVWYVGIDLQLYAMLLALLWLGARQATRWVALLTALALLVFNRDADLDMWAPYFFGAYGLGFLARHIATAERPEAQRMAVLVLGLVCAALLVEWRDRLVVAAATAALLAAAGHFQLARPWMASGVVAWLARTSYALFLVHYPVVLVVGAFVERQWPGNVAAHAFGLVAAWATSLVAATLLHEAVERGHGWHALRRLRFARA